MDDATQNEQQNQNVQSTPKSVTTTVTCPHCGKEHEVTVQVPEGADAPKMAWQG